MAAASASYQTGPNICKSLLTMPLRSLTLADPESHSQHLPPSIVIAVVCAGGPSVSHDYVSRVFFLSVRSQSFVVHFLTVRCKIL